MTWTSEKIMKTIQVHMLNECITNARLVEMTDLTPDQVQSSTEKLHAHGFIKRVNLGCYRITASGIAALESGKKFRSGPKGVLQKVKQHKDSVRVRVWRAIRIRKSFSIDDLIIVVAQGGEKDIRSNIGKYIKALECAGYLIRMAKRQQGTALTSNGFARWRLDLGKNTGPQAPVWRQSAGTVYDPNTDTEIDLLPAKQGDE